MEIAFRIQTQKFKRNADVAVDPDPLAARLRPIVLARKGRMDVPIR